MATFTPGLVHTPVTPFKADQSIDFNAYAKVLEFHLRNGADALALPMPQGEDVSLTDAESRQVLRFAVREVDGRVPVIAHVSDAATGIAADRARFAQDVGVAAIASHPPYFWRPKAATIIEHLVQIGSATRLPFFMCSTLAEDVNTPLTTDIALQVVERLENIAGLIDSSMDWVFMTEVISLAQRVRPDFQLLPATDYIVSAAAIGAKGALSPLSAIAPKLVRQVHDLCAKQQFMQARKPQEDLAALHYVVKQAGFGGLKGALRVMGRDCGAPRAPMNALSEQEQARVAAEFASMRFLDVEPRGWE
jgi:4-hydroxy-tetrahydrodipicolinate synthase